MKEVIDAIAQLGEPLFVRLLGDESDPSALFGRWRQWRHSERPVETPGTEEVRVTVTLQECHVLMDRMGARVEGGLVRGGSIEVTPPNEGTKVTVDGPSDILQIYLSRSFLETSTRGGFVCPRLFDSHDEAMQSAAMQMLVGETRRDPDDPLLVETGLHNMAQCLDVCASPKTAHVHRGGLAPAARRRVDELIAAAFDEDVVRTPTISELAGAANLSSDHFIRAFKQDAGVTPHRHVVRLRLERAIALLRDPKRTVAEVGDEIGFCTPAHFVSTFRRLMGVTPGDVKTALSR